MRDVAGLVTVRVGDADFTAGRGLFFVAQELWWTAAKYFQISLAFGGQEVHTKIAL
jgi:hypothetical protein